MEHTEARRGIRREHAGLSSLWLSQPLRARLERWALARHPREACGFLLGRREGRSACVSRVCEARNLAAEPAHDRFDVDPADHLAAETLARATGLEVVGLWHSHPDHPAVPSEADRTLAWAGWSYLILAVTAAGVRELRSWSLAGPRFEEEGVSP